MLNPVDTNTILGAQAGRPEQVTALYEHYHAGIFRYLYYRVGDRQTAEDLTSEVFLRMIRNLGQDIACKDRLHHFRPGCSRSLTTWRRIISAVPTSILKFPLPNTWLLMIPGRMRGSSII